MADSEEKGPKIYPAWIVVDESFSMDGPAIDAVNTSVKKIHQHFIGSPVDAGSIYLGFVGFADIAEEIVPLQDLSKVTQIPSYEPQGQTNYSAAFDLLREIIDRDMKTLKTQGFRRSRPMVFFITDGQATTDWASSYSKLTDQSWPYWPYIIAFGVGNEVNGSTLTEIANTKQGAYIPLSGENARLPEDVLPEIFKKVTQTLFKTLEEGETGGERQDLPLPPVAGTKQEDGRIQLGDIDD